MGKPKAYTTIKRDRQALRIIPEVQGTLTSEESSGLFAHILASGNIGALRQYCRDKRWRLRKASLSAHWRIYRASSNNDAEWEIVCTLERAELSQ